MLIGFVKSLIFAVLAGNGFRLVLTCTVGQHFL